MKIVFVVLILCSSTFATEVSTECPAMSQSREKIVKDVAVKKGKPRTQVVSQ